VRGLVQQQRLAVGAAAERSEAEFEAVVRGVFVSGIGGAKRGHVDRTDLARVYRGLDRGVTRRTDVDGPNRNVIRLTLASLRTEITRSFIAMTATAIALNALSSRHCRVNERVEAARRLNSGICATSASKRL
jgi:hypothetical protein